jgi:hypothetical protein
MSILIINCLYIQKTNFNFACILFIHLLLVLNLKVKITALSSNIHSRFNWSSFWYMTAVFVLWLDIQDVHGRTEKLWTDSYRDQNARATLLIKHTKGSNTYSKSTHWRTETDSRIKITWSYTTCILNSKKKIPLPAPKKLKWRLKLLYLLMNSRKMEHGQDISDS